MLKVNTVQALVTNTNQHFHILTSDTRLYQKTDQNERK